MLLPRTVSEILLFVLVFVHDIVLFLAIPGLKMLSNLPYVLICVKVNGSHDDLYR